MPKRQSGKINRHFAMDRWFDILEGEPPRMVDAPILHHYTDAFGVQGIVSSNSLWATATQFSNDLSEIEYAVSIAVELIEETWGKKKRLGPWKKCSLSTWYGFSMPHCIASVSHSLFLFAKTETC
jgi:hypothetical protein